MLRFEFPKQFHVEHNKLNFFSFMLLKLEMIWW